MNITQFQGWGVGGGDGGRILTCKSKDNKKMKTHMRQTEIHQKY